MAKSFSDWKKSGGSAQQPTANTAGLGQPSAGPRSFAQWKGQESPTTAPMISWEDQYQQYVKQYDMQQRAAQSLANTYRNTYEGMKRTNKEASRMTFEPGMEGYATDDMSALQMNTNPNYGKRVSDEDLAEKYRQWQEAEAKANEAKSVGDYWKSMYKFHNDADKVVADYDKRIAAMEADPNLKREASVAGSGNKDIEALKAERDAFIQTNTQYKNAAEDYAVLMAWNAGNKGTVASYEAAKSAYDTAEADLQALYADRKSKSGPEIAAFGAGGSTPDSERFANDEEIQAAIRKRDQAKMVMDYAYANRFEDIKNQEDYDLTADKGEIAWQDFKANEQGQTRGMDLQDEYGNPMGASVYDPYYMTNYADQNENWTEDEKKTFYYLFATNRENAFTYGNEVNSRYARAEAEENSWGTREWAQRDFGTGAVTSLLSIPAGLAGGLYDYMDMVMENNIRGGVYESQYGGWSNWSEDVRGSIGNALNSYGTIPDSVPVLGGKGWGDAYQLLMSMADSAVAVAGGGGPANLLFFGSAAASTTRNALERGLSPDKALGLGFAAGIAEVAGETFSVENLLSKDLEDYLRTGIFKSLLVQGGVEGSEEFFTTILNTFADAIINGDQSELQQKIEQYTASGMGYDEAKKKAWVEWAEDLGADAIGGFLSGFGMAGTHIGLNVAANSMTPYQGDVQTLMDLTELTDEGSKSRRFQPKLQGALDAENVAYESYKAALEQQGVNTGGESEQAPAPRQSVEERRAGIEEEGAAQIQQEQAAEAAQDEAAQGQERTPAQKATPAEQKAAQQEEGKAQTQERTPKPRATISQFKGMQIEAALREDLSAKDRTVLEEKATARLTDLGVKDAGRAASAVVDRVLGTDRGAIGNAVSGLNFRDSRVRIVLQELTEQLGGQKTSASWLGNTDLMTVGQNNAWTRTIENGLKQVRIKGSSERLKVTGAKMVDGKLNLTVEQGNKDRTMSQDQLDLTGDQTRALGLLTRILGDDAANAYDGMTIGNMSDVLRVMEYASAFGTVRDVLGRAGVKDEAALASPLRKGLTDAQVLRALAAGRKLGPVPEGQRVKSRRGTGAVSLEGGTLNGRKLGGVKNREAVMGSKRYQTIKKLAEQLGIDVVLYESDVTNDKGDLEDAPHGAYKDGVIWLDWNAGVYNINKFNNENGVRDYNSEAEAIIFLTMSHELTHFLEQNAENEYNELRDFITQYMADNGKDFNGMVRRKLAEQSDIDHDEAVREVIADTCQTMLVDSKYVQQLIAEKPTLWERIRDWIRNFFGFAKTQAKGQEIEAVRDVAAQISKIWDRALQVAVESRLSEETLQEMPTVKEQAAASILTIEQQQAILDEAKSRGVRTDRLTDLYRQQQTVRNTPSQQTPLMLPAHVPTAKEKAAIKRRFNKAVEELMDSYLFGGIDLSREQAEQMVREYAAANGGYFSMADEMKQRGMTMKQAAEDRRAWLDAREQEAFDALDEGSQDIIDAFGPDGTIELSDDGEFELAISEDGSTIAYSPRTYQDGGRDKLIKALKENGHTQDEISDTVNLIDDAMDYLQILAAGYSKNMGYNTLSEHLLANVTTYIKSGEKATQALSTLVNNGDYPINLDLALICKKRVAYMRLMNKLIDDGILDKVNFGGSAIAEVNTILRNNGFETACLGCFVESRRLQLQNWAETIVEEWNAEVDKLTTNPRSFGFAAGTSIVKAEDVAKLVNELEKAGKKNDKGNLNLGKGSVQQKMGRLLKKVPSLRQHLTVADLLNPKGLTALRAYDQNLFSLVKQRYGAASPKIVQDFNPYNGEIADLTFKFVKELTGNAVKGAQQYTTEAKEANPKQKGESTEEYNKRIETLAMQKYLYNIGGARIQSFSDFMIENVFDYLQIFADMSARRLPMHGYTKENTCLRLFGMTGAKWNGSLIAHVEQSMGKEYAGLMPVSEAKGGRGIVVTVDGKQYAICFDDYARHVATGSFIQSIGMKDIIALQLDPRYSRNVGSITIGVSDKQILAMLDSDLFRMVIPYHSSGMLPEYAKLVGVDLYNDYTDYQNTRVKVCYDLQGNVVEGFKQKDGKPLKIDTSYAYNKEVQRTGDARKAADNYIKWCAERHPVYDGGRLVGYAVFDPKFSNSPFGTDFTKHRNYYKLLEDFNVYDCLTGESALQGAVEMRLPSEETRLTPEQLDAYKQALRDTGLYSEKEIEKYAQKAQQTFKEIIADEVKGRAEYESRQAKVWDSTIQQVEDTLLEKYPEAIEERAAQRAKAADKKAKKKAAQEGGMVQFSGRTSVLDMDIPWDPDNNSHLQDQLRAAQSTLDKMDPVASITYDPKHDSYIDKLDEVLRNWGYKINRADVGSFLYDKKAISSVRGHISTDAEAAAVIASPYVLKRGEIISGHRNHKGNGHPSITFGGPAVINGERADIGVAVLFGDKDRVHAIQILAPDGSEFTLPVIEKTTSTRADVPEKTGPRSPNADIASGHIVSEDTTKSNTKVQESARDQQYLAAVERGDMETAQRMVDEAARAAGYNIKAWHGSRYIFNEFSRAELGKSTGTEASKRWFFAADYDTANSYYPAGVMRELMKLNPNMYSQKDIDRMEKRGVAGKLYSLYIKMENPLDVDVAGYDYEAHKESKDAMVEYLDQAERENRDGIILRNVRDNNLHPSEENSTDYLFKYSEQVKLADPVTYDDAGNVIPLSERFNTSTGDIRYSARTNLGYHAGDLGKAEHLNIQGRDRGTGHFGTGTYFVGVEEKVTKDSYYGKRPQHAVDFTDYNLFKVRTDRDGYRLHDFLRIVDGGIKQDWILPALDNQFNIVSPTGYYDLAKSKYGEDWVYGDNLLNAMLEYAADNGISIKTLDEYKADEGKGLDDSDAKDYYEEYVKDTVKEEIDSVNAEYRKFMDALFDVRYFPGFTRAKLFSALTKVADYQDATPRNARVDSYATVFMKAMGYEGVDVRGTRLDNTEYGSVIYDVKPETVQYSVRTGDRTDRELLLDASDASLTDAEQKARAAYRAQVDGYRSRQQAVTTLLNSLDKAVQDGDAEAATKLRAKLTAAEKKMAEALAGLTEAERGPELREILRRERDIQRRRTDRRIRESYGRRELRQKVDRLWKDLTKRLSSPSEKKNIPVNVMMQAVDVLEAINMDGTRPDSKAGQKLRDKLNELGRRYDALKNDKDFRQAAMYDPQVAEFLDNMIELVGDTPINRMSTEQLAAVYNTLKALDHVARSALKVRLRTMEYSAYDISRRMTEETRSVGKQKAGAIDMYLNAGLSPARMFNRLGGYHKDSTWSQVYEMLNDGQLRQTQLQVEGSMLFEDLLAAKDYGKFVDPKNTVDVGLKDADGKTIEITHGMLVSLYMHLMNEQNRRHVAYGGLTIPGLSDYYNGKKIKGTENAKSAAGVLQEIAEINDRLYDLKSRPEGQQDPGVIEALEAKRDSAAEKALSYLEELQAAVEGKLTDYDWKWISACRELFDGFSKRALNEATMQVYGIKRANVENYFPIWVDGNFLNTPFESVAKDFSLENAGFMKERVDSAKPIRLADVSDVAASQIRKVAQYAGLMPVIHDFNKIWGKTQTGYRDSVRQAVMQTYGQSGVNYIENLMADLNGARGMENSPLGEMLNRLRGHMAQASLTLSLRTAMGQVASYPTAAAVLGWDAIRQGITNYKKVDPQLILKWSPLLKYRMQGYRDPELGQIAQMNSKFDRAWKKARWATGWIQAFDGFTVGQLVWSASEAYVQIHDKSLKKGTDAYYEAVAKKFNEAVELTQPNYTTMQRPDILRNPNALVRQLTMFLTQRLQNFNIMYDAAATYSQMKKDRAAGKYGVTNEDVRQAGMKARTAALSQVTAAATIVAFKFLADVILHSMNAYRDDDDELTKESVSMELLDMFLDSLAGNVLGGGELYDLIESKAFGKTYYGIEVSGVSTVTDALKAVNDFYDKVAKGEVSWKDADKLAKKISVIAGIPYANAEKIIRGGIWHVQDMINGEFGSFEAGVDRTTGQQAHRLWRAYDAKDFAQANKIRSEVGDDDKLNQALAAYIKKQYADGKITKFEAQRQLEKYAGKDKETAEKTMREYSSEVETGIKFSQIEDSFLLGDITAQKAQQMLVKYGGLDAQTAKMKVDFWSYQNKNPGTRLEFSGYKTYVSKYQSIGLTVAQYESYSERLKDCKGVDADGDGKTDSGSKKAEVVKLIDSLSLTPAQKDQLYYANNYGASGLKDTPWHK